MKILLIGNNGQVGWALQRSLAPVGFVTSIGRKQVDLSQPGTLAPFLATAQADVIINAAAYTAVDKAEIEPEVAMVVNAESVGILADHCARYNKLLVHYSTDYVFDGASLSAYTESDKANPLSVYGATKLAGEAAIAEAGGRHLIFRTSWVYGSHGANFARTMLRLAGERDELKIVADQFGSPTGADLIADVTAQIVKQNSSLDDVTSGTYHLAASGTTNWRDYAAFVVSEAIACGVVLKTTPDRIKPIKTADYTTPATRPLNSRLDTAKLVRRFNLVLPDWRDGVRRTVQEIARQLK